ncbi:MAG: DEAD/DEAH box helicase family protein [Chloracidobacterium sp.]|nr:DEAD/DEAH box helicase family protein [Chloracidobacterium sp.]
MLKHKPKDAAEVDELFSQCSVVIGTSHIVGQAIPEVQKRMAFHCSHLFIDEAHHVAAATWSKFKKHFKDRRVLQFTATPFREDDKPLDGKIIYKYPLNRAQEKGYFYENSFQTR